MSLQGVLGHQVRGKLRQGELREKGLPSAGSIVIKNFINGHQIDIFPIIEGMQTTSNPQADKGQSPRMPGVPKVRRDHRPSRVCQVSVTATSGR